MESGKPDDMHNTELWINARNDNAGINVTGYPMMSSDKEGSKGCG